VTFRTGSTKQAFKHDESNPVGPVCSVSGGSPILGLNEVVLSNINEDLNSELSKTAGKVFNKCLSCHDSSHAKAKRLPFTDVKVLTKLLLSHDRVLYSDIIHRISPDAGEMRMPPSKTLDKTDREEMIKFLQELMEPSLK
jgi:hypothetical protein